jgi:hypothetical protein
MVFFDARIDAPLNDYVDSIYYVKEDFGNTEKVILPDLKTDLIFLFDSRLTGWTDQGKPITITSSLGFGFRKEPLRFRYHGMVEMLGIRFLPFGFSKLFGFPPREISGFRLLDELPGKEMFRVIREQLHHEQLPVKKVEIVKSWLSSRLSKQQERSNLPERAINRIASTHGILSLRTICNNSPSEYKQLQRYCIREFDISPKYYSRMVRFEHLHRHIQNTVKPDWLSLVSDLELTDQSHLIKEIREFTGQAPQAFFAEAGSYI